MEENIQYHRHEQGKEHVLLKTVCILLPLIIMFALYAAGSIAMIIIGANFRMPFIWVPGIFLLALFVILLIVIAKHPIEVTITNKCLYIHWFTSDRVVFYDKVTTVSKGPYRSLTIRVPGGMPINFYHMCNRDLAFDFILGEVSYRSNWTDHSQGIGFQPTFDEPQPEPTPEPVVAVKEPDIRPKEPAKPVVEKKIPTTPVTRDTPFEVGEAVVLIKEVGKYPAGTKGTIRTILFNFGGRTFLFLPDGEEEPIKVEPDDIQRPQFVD